METIYANISDAAKRYNATVGGQTDYVAGANIAGFEKVVDAMIAQGVWQQINNYSKIENPTHCRKTQKCRVFVFC